MTQLNLYQRPSRQHLEPDRFSFSSWTLDTNTSDGGTSDKNSSECSTESSYSDVISPSSAGDISGDTSGNQSFDEALSKHNSSLGCELMWTSSQEISETTPSCMSPKSGTSFLEDSTVSTLSFNNTQTLATKKSNIDVANPRKVPEHISIFAKDTPLNTSAVSMKAPLISKVDWVCYPIDNKCSCKMLCTSSK